MRLLVLLLLAAPLSAQQTVVVPDVNVQVEPTPITIENNVEVLTDSIMQLRIAEAIEGIRAELATSECNTCGGASTTMKIGVAVLLPVLMWIGWELRGIKNKDDIHNVENDVDVDVDVEVPDRKRKHDHGHGES